MPHKLTGRDGQTVTIPDGGHGLQGSDGRMVAIPKGGHGLQGSDGRMVAIPAEGHGFRVAMAGWSQSRRESTACKMPKAEYGSNPPNWSIAILLRGRRVPNLFLYSSA
jgi:hypothetical protein